MTIADARPFVGRSCWIRWTDRTGKKHGKLLHIDDLQFMPLYGSYLITSAEELNLDRVTRIRPKD